MKTTTTKTSTMKTTTTKTMTTKTTTTKTTTRTMTTTTERTTTKTTTTKTTTTKTTTTKTTTTKTTTMTTTTMNTEVQIVMSGQFRNFAMFSFGVYMLEFLKTSELNPFLLHISLPLGVIHLVKKSYLRLCDSILQESSPIGTQCIISSDRSSYSDDVLFYTQWQTNFLRF